MLIGGLGMGFTLRAALASLGSDASITVAELVPAVVSWAQGPMAHIFGESLSDPRVNIRVTDVAHLISASSANYDAILLDVDRSEEHTSELQSLMRISYAVFCLKKKN